MSQHIDDYEAGYAAGERNGYEAGVKETDEYSVYQHGYADGFFKGYMSAKKEYEPKHGICEDCLFLDSHDDFTFACKKGKEMHDLNGTCDKWRSAYLRGEAEPVKMMCNGAYINCPAHKDYERGYKDGQAEAQMKAEPVKHGRWIINNETEEWVTIYCDQCHDGMWNRKGDPYPNYCFNCGADMRGEQDDSK